MVLLLGATIALFTAIMLLTSGRAMPKPNTSFHRETTMIAWYGRKALQAVTVGMITFLVTARLSTAIIASLLVLAAPLAVRRVLQAGRQRVISSQMVDALAMLANSLRAGLSITQGFQNLAHDLPAPLGAEFRHLSTEISFGASVHDGLESLSSRLHNDDVSLFVTAVLVQRQTGGNLSSVLGTLAGTIRERQKLAEKVRTATAQGRLSGAVIAGLPPVMALAITVIQPGFFTPMTGSLVGWGLIVLMVVMNTAGWVMISRICRVAY